jgi:hypothetical protein
MKTMIIAVITFMAAAVCSPGLASDEKQNEKPAVTAEANQDVKSAPKLSDIPGITTPDRTPNACVNCHKNYPEMKKDFRLTVILAEWRNGTDPDILEKARACAPEGVTLKGKHPDVSSLIKIIPNDCLMCHSRNSSSAPPFAKLLHAIHLTGGEKNGFLARANGTCTSCHKLDQKTGTWGLGSGEEK